MMTVQFISSAFLQLVFLPLILVGQDLQGRHSEVRAETDFNTNVKAEGEIREILNHLLEQDKQLAEAVGRIELLLGKS